ncbi:MAG: helix-turn-helix domain-containing protein [Solirubrobacterales bacterium]|nr:helix-turn-helix domain-containing protein [Solirubrobacterales bacterium]MBV9716041.1 helix-turn-helix domain-containing protein [Solirubrobacterales bacterium]
MAKQPWHELPPEIAGLLRPWLPQLADEMIEAVRGIPAYSRPMEGPFGKGVRAGVEAALRHFLAEIEESGAVARDDVYRVLGRGEMRAGRSLDALLSAYRIGARVAWRRFAAIGVEHGVPPGTLYRLAESLFAYIDVLSAESAEGHALEQSAAAGELQLHRRRLVRLLVREPPADPEAIEALAAEADWPLPRAVAVVAIGGRGRAAAASHLPADALAETFGEIDCAVVPDPDGPGRRGAIERAVAGAGASAGLGTTVAWPEAAVSFRRAEAALGLAAGAPGLIVARERVGELLLRADSRLAGELAADRLAPLAGLSAGARARLTETLRAWLGEQGRLGPVAARLGVHPQTARYRLTRLRELFGEALDDPEQRFWLELALRLQATGPT